MQCWVCGYVGTLNQCNLYHIIVTLWYVLAILSVPTPHIRTIQYVLTVPLPRAFSPDVAESNADHRGNKYRIAPISVELRPTAALTVLGFVLPEAEVNLSITQH